MKERSLGGSGVVSGSRCVQDLGDRIKVALAGYVTKLSSWLVVGQG